jgi:hypothetical protein
MPPQLLQFLPQFLPLNVHILRLFEDIVYSTDSSRVIDVVDSAVVTQNNKYLGKYLGKHLRCFHGQYDNQQNGPKWAKMSTQSSAQSSTLSTSSYFGLSSSKKSNSLKNEAKNVPPFNDHCGGQTDQGVEVRRDMGETTKTNKNKGAALRNSAANTA